MDLWPSAAEVADIRWTLVPVVDEPGVHLAVFGDGSYARWTPTTERPGRGRHAAPEVDVLPPDDTLELEVRALEDNAAARTLPMRILPPAEEGLSAA